MSDDEQVSEEVQLVVFSLGDEEFGVDIKSVREIIKMTEITRVPNSPEFVEGVINLRGQITTVIDLRKRLDIPPRERDEDTRIVIVDLEKTTVGMIVDSVSEVLRLPKKDIDPTPAISTDVEADYIRGVGKLKKGEQDRLLILLDLKKILSREEKRELESVPG
ncbi:MAG: chemotaxis protein CheW [Euryarchaeota archaeon]|nr:chemotaxis protein CheW [Euryarchaeota archaeon]